MTVEVTDIYEAALRRGRRIGELRSAADWSALRETLNSAILEADANLQSSYVREAFEAAVELYAQLIVLGTELNDNNNLAIALHRVAHAYQYARTDTRDRNLHHAVDFYIASANSYVAASNYEESGACIGRAAGCIVDLQYPSNEHVTKMLNLIDQLDMNRIAEPRTKANIAFNKAQLISFIQYPYDTAPDQIRKSFNGILEAELYFKEDGERNEALVTTQLTRILISLHHAVAKKIRIGRIFDHMGELPAWLQRFMIDDIESYWETIDINPQILGLNETPIWIDKTLERKEANRELSAEIDIVRAKHQTTSALEPIDGKEITLDPSRLQAALEWTITDDEEKLTLLVQILNFYDSEANPESYLMAVSGVVYPAATRLPFTHDTVRLFKNFSSAYEKVSSSLNADETNSLVQQSPVVLRFTSFALAHAGLPEEAVRVLDISRQIIISKQFPQLGLRRQKRSNATLDSLLYLISSPYGVALILRTPDRFYTRIVKDASSKTLTVATSAVAPGQEGILVAQEIRLDDLESSIERALDICRPVARAIVDLTAEAAVRTATLITTGTASVIPWSAVPVGDDGRTLNEYIELSVSPFSLKTPEAPRTALTQVAHLFALSNGGQHSPLPGVSSEIRVARKYLQKLGISEIYSDTGPTKKTVAKALVAGGIVHIATHSGLDFASPFNSGIALDDGPISALEILELDCSRIELAVLSSCESGKVNPFYFPDEIIGLQSCLVYAGARRVVATLWPVSDSATLLIMSKFYAELSDLNSLSTSAVRRALTSAQLWLRTSTVTELQAHCQELLIPDNAVRDLFNPTLNPGDTCFSSPYFWAAFCLMVRELPLASN